MNCTVLGAGSFGITLSRLLNENSHSVKIWEFDSEACRRLENTREEPDKLPGIRLPENIRVTNNLAESLEGAEMVVWAVPCQVIRKVIEALCRFDFSGLVSVNVAKGIEKESLERVSEILSGVNPSIRTDNYCMLSGPSHAEEVARHIPTTVVAASSQSETACLVQETFNNAYFRVYTNDDVVGVELAGALKNVIALASGIADGLGLGDNTKGALLTRGMVEITRLGLAMGAAAETFGGLAGYGDLITTCISRHSRNRNVGEAIGQGQKLPEVLSGMTMVAEGVETTKSASKLAEKFKIEMPITEKIHDVLFKGDNPREALKQLMVRELKPEGI